MRGRLSSLKYVDKGQLYEDTTRRTVVLVSHRVSTMNVADVVYEMENGRLS